MLARRFIFINLLLYLTGRIHIELVKNNYFSSAHRERMVEKREAGSINTDVSMMRRDDP